MLQTVPVALVDAVAIVACFRLKHVVILNCCILAICVLMAIFLPKIGTIIR